MHDSHDTLGTVRRVTYPSQWFPQFFNDGLVVMTTCWIPWHAARDRWVPRLLIQRSPASISSLAKRKDEKRGVERRTREKERARKRETVGYRQRWPINAILRVCPLFAALPSCFFAATFLSRIVERDREKKIRFFFSGRNDASYVVVGFVAKIVFLRTDGSVSWEAEGHRVKSSSSSERVVGETYFHWRWLTNCANSFLFFPRRFKASLPAIAFDNRPVRVATHRYVREKCIVYRRLIL